MLYIFDWDGTLCNSTDKIIKCMQSAIKDANFSSVSSDKIQHIIGLGLPEAIKTLLPETGPDDIAHIRSRYIHHFDTVYKETPPLFPTVIDTLEKLVSAGHQIAVATGKSRIGLNKMLKELGMSDVFHATRCADETRSKPHPLMLHELLQETGSCKDDALMIGDTSFDLEMAQKAKMRSIAVDYGAHSIESLEVFQPILCISEMAELLNHDLKLIS